MFRYVLIFDHIAGRLPMSGDAGGLDDPHPHGNRDV